MKGTESLGVHISYQKLFLVFFLDKRTVVVLVFSFRLRIIETVATQAFVTSASESKAGARHALVTTKWGGRSQKQT